MLATAMLRVGHRLVQPALLPLKKGPGKPDKNFKRGHKRGQMGQPRARLSGPKPVSGDPGIERCITFLSGA